MKHKHIRYLLRLSVLNKLVMHCTIFFSFNLECQIDNVTLINLLDVKFEWLKWRHSLLSPVYKGFLTDKKMNCLNGLDYKKWVFQ